MSYQPDSQNSREFERLLRDGIMAAKSDQRRLAQSLLHQALLIEPGDARPYLWLSETTDDLSEKRDYLERAVAIDPGNPGARRGLAILTGKLKVSDLLPEGAHVLPRRPGEALEAQPHAYVCPQCGGQMSYNVSAGQLTCSYCGFTEIRALDDMSTLSGEQIADRLEQALDFVMPTSRGHQWAEARHRFCCARCDALNLLPAGQTSTQCAYCGSNQLIASQETAEILEPHLVIPFQFDPQEGSKHVRQWLGRGFFLPDDFLSEIQHLQLRPAYYSCWTFDGALKVAWSCEVKEGSGRYAQWSPRNGDEMRFFDDVLVAGILALEPHEFEQVEPFNFNDAQAYRPDYLVGWPAMIYDRSLADASLLAREKVTKKVNNELYAQVEPGREKRNLHTNGGSWSGMTFKHVLLPLWVGNYQYRRKEYHLLVNGQTGKVAGKKPSDPVKIVFSAATLVLLLILVGFLLFWLLGNFQG